MAKQLTTKIMEGKLKYGWCVSDFANYLECDESGFWIKFEKFDDEAKVDYRRRLAHNENKRKKQRKPRKQRYVKNQKQTDSYP